MPAPPATQPLAVKQLGVREFHAEMSAAKAVDRLALQDFGILAFGERKSLTSESAEEEYFDPAHIRGSLNLSHQGCGYMVRLALNGPKRGTLWEDGRCSDTGNHPVRAPLRRLVPAMAQRPAATGLTTTPITRFGATCGQRRQST
jgi:hypothetical protein